MHIPRIIFFSILILCLTFPSLSYPAQGEIPTVSRLIEAGQFEEAIRYLTVAIRNDPENSDYRFWIGAAYFRSGMVHQAEEAFLEAVRLNPAEARIHYNLGAVYFRGKKWDLAIESFLKAAELAPGWKAQGYLNVGLAYFKQGKKKEAVEWFQKTIQANPAPSTKQMAHEMLNLTGTVIKTTPKGKWQVEAGSGREYDTNVFLTSAEQVETRDEDWATTGSLHVKYLLPLRGNLYLLSPGYYFFGRWFDSKGRDYNYLLQDFRFDLEIPGMRIRPRLGYSYVYTHLGEDSFLELQRLLFNSRLLEFGKNAIGLGGYFSINNALDQNYNYLSGYEWKLSISETAILFRNRGYIYLALAIGRSDLSDIQSGPQFFSYSYDTIEPSIQMQLPLIEKLRAKGLLRYQYRYYHDKDVWTTGSKKRIDERYAVELSVIRPILRYVEAEVKYWTQINQSNIGDDIQDYVDRDYNKGTYSLSIKTDF